MQFSSKFFCNKNCEYFPCHQGIDEEEFNCLFCYCPLYAQGQDCGGNFLYLDNGVKDCSDCALPHDPDNYDYIMNRLCTFYPYGDKSGF